jgi:hypothetical protein
MKGRKAELQLSDRGEIEFRSLFTVNPWNILGRLVECQLGESFRKMTSIAAKENLNHDLRKPKIRAVKRP